MEMSEWFFIALLSVVAGLDRTAVAQLQLSRPLVCAALAGFILDIFPMALQLGVMLELLWIMRIPVGAAIAPDDTQAAIGGVVLVKLFASGAAEHDLILIVVIGILAVIFAEVGKCFDVWARHRNEYFFQRSAAQLAGNRWHHPGWSHLSGLSLFAAASLFSVGFVVAAGFALLFFCDSALSSLSIGSSRILPMVFPVVGIAATLTMLRVKNTILLLVGGFVVTYGLLLVLGC
ncbi:MAG: PTS sugar transporter subunit IIC [Desulfuromonas sp.]|nr:PTS sugar transporter subunit IIC [Desulfuromonas sp.]